MADDGVRVRHALRAAQMYYVQEMTTAAIAHELGTSRSSISRLLTFARRSGLVEIQIHSPFERGTRLEQALKERYRVGVQVVPTRGALSDVDRLERVAATAARVLNRYLDSHMTLGIAWGSTLSAISRHLQPKPTHGLSVVQLNGAGNNLSTGIDYASEILQRFSTAYSAEVHQFPVPAFFDDPRTKESLWLERSTKRLLDIQARTDIALFGLGSPFAEVPSHVYIGGYLEAGDYERLSEDRVVGDAATVFYRIDGSHRDIEMNARATGPDLDRLTKVARRICVVSGLQKFDSVRGALAAGLITDLVLDEGLARALATAP
ncbi:MAG: hypothetical protein RI885_1865 [Actinomycetota bacterium]